MSLSAPATTVDCNAINDLDDNIQDEVRMSTPIISLQVVIGNQVGGRAAHTGRSYDKDSFDPLGNKRYKLGYLGQAGYKHALACYHAGISPVQNERFLMG